MMIKKIVYSAIAILLVLMIAGVVGIKQIQRNWFKEKPLHLSYTAEAKPIKFCWASNTYGDYTENHNAILIPVKLAGFSQQFYLQFDTGAPTSMLHGNSLQSLKKNGLAFNEIEKGEESFVEQIDFILGGNATSVSSIRILPAYGEALKAEDSLQEITLGTIGTDMMVDRITAIDFKNKTIQLYEERPDWMEALTGFQSFDFSGRRIMLPCHINDKKLTLLYDSGSSAFGLITTKKRYEDYSDDDRPEIRYTSNNKDRPIPICHKSTEQMIEIGNASLPLKRISYVDMYAGMQQFVSPFTRVGGWLGNKPFTESVLIIDCKSQEFIALDKLEGPKP